MGSSATTPLVKTSLGDIKGREIKTRSGRKLAAFFNVPYAKPPLGDRRFSRPEPVDPWGPAATLDASKVKVKACTQKTAIFPESERILIGSEDCLYLNVYSTNLPSSPSSDRQGQAASAAAEDSNNGTRKLPVVIWIHGGAFCLGSNDYKMYGPQYLLDHEDGGVFVGVNYRLGPLGFLSLECDEAPGNQGLHDQVLAMRWVQSHILHFGGDPDQVTLFGESAGAMSLFLHLVSPLSKGLFHRMIALSGSGSSPFVQNDRRPSIYGRTFASKFGIGFEESDEEALRKLRKLSAKSIVGQTTLFKDFHEAIPCPWKPVVDSSYASVPFLPQSFQEAIKAGNFNKDVIVLAGSCSEEGLIMSAQFYRYPLRYRLLFEDWAYWTSQYFFGREPGLLTGRDENAMAKLRQKFFPRYQEEAPPFNDANLKIIQEIISLSIFKAPLQKDVEMLMSHGAKVYMLNFAYEGFMTISDVFRLSVFKLMVHMLGKRVGFKWYHKRLGTCHGDDLFYAFPMTAPGFPKALKHPMDVQVSKKFVQYLMRFVWSGNPNAPPMGNAAPSRENASLDDNESSSALSEVYWAPYNQSLEVLTINRSGSSEMGGHVEERALSGFINQISDEMQQPLSDEPIPEIYAQTAEKRHYKKGSCC